MRPAALSLLVGAGFLFVLALLLRQRRRAHALVTAKILAYRPRVCRPLPPDVCPACGFALGIHPPQVDELVACQLVMREAARRAARAEGETAS